MAGAPIGNQNAVKSKVVADCLRRAIVQDDGKKLREGTEKLLDAYAAGEPWAHQFVRDTLDGKPAQALAVSGDGEGGPIINKVTVEFVNKAT